MVEISESGKTARQKHILHLLKCARQALAPEMTTLEYYEALKEYETRHLNRVDATTYPNQVISIEEASKQPDNSEIYETVAYRYNGLDAVRELLADGNPVAFVGWHHGARGHADYALVRVLPDIAVFTRWLVQYGKVFSTPMATLGALGLVKIMRYLEDCRPNFYYLDGAPVGECVQLPIMGINCNFSTAPIKMFRSVAGLRIVPVTNFYIGETAVGVNFLPALGTDGKLADMDDRNILTTLLSQLEQEQRKHAPCQVLLNYLPHRERLAREAMTSRKPDRQKTT